MPGPPPPDGSVQNGRTVVYLQVVKPDAKPDDDESGKGAGKDGKGGKGAKAAGAGDAKKSTGAADAPPKKKEEKKQGKSLFNLDPEAAEQLAKQQAKSLQAAAESGAPFCEQCAAVKQRLTEKSQAIE